MLKAVIIDDETAAIKNLTVLINKYVPDLIVAGTTTTGKAGIVLIEDQKPDIVFLDISMPAMGGFSLLQKLTYKNFHLVFTTAHAKYAIQAIKHHPFDYLLKPVDIDELKQTVLAISQALMPDTHSFYSGQTNERRLGMNSRIGLPIRDGLAYVTVADIVWIESHGNYSTFHIKDGKKYVVSKNIGEYESILPLTDFFRAHKSYLINIRKVRKYISNVGYFVEMEDSSVIEISRRNKQQFLQLMNS